MSYTPGFAPDAKSQWHALDPHHQELALDVLERLCAAPPVRIEHVAEAIEEQGGCDTTASCTWSWITKSAP